MDNKELNIKFQEILSTKNFFDMLENAIAFEKEYKQSSFYKKTKLSLIEALKYHKAWTLLDVDQWIAHIQKSINSLDLTKINEIVNQIGDMFQAENAEILEMMEMAKEISL